MHNQLLQGILIKNLKKSQKFFRALHTGPGFHRYTHIRSRCGQSGKHSIQKAVKLLRKSQKARPLSFTHDSPGRTAQIQVHLPVTIISQTLCELQESLCPVRQNLRDDVQSSVVFRKNLLQLPLFEASLFVRLQKRRKILIQAAIHGRLGIAVNVSGDPLHWGQIYLRLKIHTLSPCPFHIYKLSIFSSDFFLFFLSQFHKNNHRADTVCNEKQMQYPMADCSLCWQRSLFSSSKHRINPIYR